METWGNTEYDLFAVAERMKGASASPEDESAYD